MSKSEIVRRVKLAQLRLCSAALQREVGEVNNDELTAAAMEYARCVSDWRAAIQMAIDDMPDLNIRPEAMA